MYMYVYTCILAKIDEKENVNLKEIKVMYMDWFEGNNGKGVIIIM